MRMSILNSQFNHPTSSLHTHHNPLVPQAQNPPSRGFTRLIPKLGHHQIQATGNSLFTQESSSELDYNGGYYDCSSEVIGSRQKEIEKIPVRRR